MASSYIQQRIDAERRNPGDQAMIAMAFSLLVEVTLIIPRTNSSTGWPGSDGRRRTRHFRSATAYLAIAGSRVIRVRAAVRACATKIRSNGSR